MALDFERGFSAPIGTVQVYNPWPFDHHPRVREKSGHTVVESEACKL